MQTKVACFKAEAGLLYFVQDHPCFCIPHHKDLCLQFLHNYHDAPIAGHLGVDKTYEGVARSYFWPKVSKEVCQYVISCNACQRAKSTNRQPAGLLQLLEVPGQHWEQVSIDFVV